MTESMLDFSEDTDGGQCWGGLLLKSTQLLQSFEHVQLHVVLRAPGDQLLNLLYVCRLVSVSDDAEDYWVICKLQEFNKWVSWDVKVKSFSGFCLNISTCICGCSNAVCWFLEVFPSPCNNVTTELSVFNAVIWGPKDQVIQSWFSVLSLVYQNFFRFSQSPTGVLYCRQ